jgi:hypothetical protein
VAFSKPKISHQIRAIQVRSSASFFGSCATEKIILKARLNRFEMPISCTPHPVTILGGTDVSPVNVHENESL